MDEKELIVPYIPTTILTILKNDYPEIKELLENKREATLIFLKSFGAMAVYDGTVHLDVGKDVKDWDEFITFAENYSKYIVQKGVQKYQAKENHLEEQKKQYKRIELGLIDPAVSMISNTITREYLNRFPLWPDSGTQEDFIEIDLKSTQEANDLRIYWTCKGEIFVKDTKYDIPINGSKYRAEFSGKPEFQLSIFDLQKIKFCNDMAKKNMKKLEMKLDELNEKLLNQKFEKLLLNGIEF